MWWIDFGLASVLDKVYCEEEERRSSREAGWGCQLGAH